MKNTEMGDIHLGSQSPMSTKSVEENVTHKFPEQIENFKLLQFEYAEVLRKARERRIRSQLLEALRLQSSREERHPLQHNPVSPMLHPLMRPMPSGSPSNRSWEPIPDETVDVEELNLLAETFKQRRILLGFRQIDVARKFRCDQSKISRFEALKMSVKNMCKLRPFIQKWLRDADESMTDPTIISETIDDMSASEGHISGGLYPTNSNFDRFSSRKTGRKLVIFPILEDNSDTKVKDPLSPILDVNSNTKVEDPLSPILDVNSNTKVEDRLSPILDVN